MIPTLQQGQLGRTVLGGGAAAAVNPNFSDVELLWMCDEGNGATTPIDRSSRANTMARTGSAIGTTSVVGPFGGSCWRFPGAGSYVDATIASLNLGSMTNWTIEAWLRFDSGSPDFTVVGLGATGSNMYWERYGGGGSPNMYLGDGSVNTISGVGWTGLNADTWTHAAIVKASTNYYGLVAGSRVATGTIALTTGARTNIRMGNGNTLTLTGYIGAIRVSTNVALYTDPTYVVPTSVFPTS